MARFPFVHDQDYYRRLLFGDGHTRDPLRAPNAADYFREVSRDKATYTDAGICGPVLWEGWDGSSDPEQCAAAVRLLKARRGSISGRSTRTRAGSSRKTS